MFPETFTLLQNEGFLMQGCFKSSLADLLHAETVEPSPFYAAFFNYSIGLERLLKILLLLDNWHRNRQFLTDEELRAKGHDVEKLYNDARPLFPKHAVPWQKHYDLDPINRDLLKSLAGFANGSRYYNLNALAGALKHSAKDPIHSWQAILYRVYTQDVPGAEPVPPPPTVPEHSIPSPQLDCHHVIIAATRPYMCWRLVQLLVPLKELLTVLREHIQKDDFELSGDEAEPSVPFMEEFLDFVSNDKTVVLEPEDDWPN